MSSVVLPAPFGPIRPTLSPRRIVAEKSLTIRRDSPVGVAKRIETFFSSATILPLGMPASTSSRTRPSDSRRAARCARSACRRCTRPTLRVRRASTPFRTQTSSCASSLSARALASASADELVRLPRLVGRERARIAAQHAAVELDDARRDGVEEGAVVRHDHDAALEADEQLLEPGDRVEVEVVGRLVEQQHVGDGDERARERDALLGAARELGDRARAVEMEVRQRRLDALLPVPGVERLDPRLQRIEVGAFGVRLVGVAHDARLGDAFADGVEHGAGVVEQRLLRHVADAQALRLLQQAVVELLEPGDDLEQRRLAGAVAADQADALAGLERERRAVEQGDVAEGEVGIGEGEDGHGRKAAQPCAGGSARSGERALERVDEHRGDVEAGLLR